jgi:hypothetical protein
VSLQRTVVPTAPRLTTWSPGASAYDARASAITEPGVSTMSGRFAAAVVAAGAVTPYRALIAASVS